MTQCGIRDSLLTALPRIAAGNSTDWERTTTTESVSYPMTSSTEASTTTREALYVTNSSNGGLLSRGYQRENPKFKTGDILNRTDEKRSRDSRNRSESINTRGLGPGLEFRGETRLDFLNPRSLFRAKVGGRDGRLAQRANPREKVREGRSISRRGKYNTRLFRKSLDVWERGDVFRRLLDIRTGDRKEGEDEGEDKRGFMADDESRAPLPVGLRHSFTGGWCILYEGLVLSSVYWGWLITAIMADWVINALGAKTVLTFSISVGGLIGLLTHAMSLGGPWVMVGFRIVFGGAQGFCYPAVMRLLQGIPESSRNTAGAIVFLGPPIGSCVGAGLGSLGQWYVSTYLLGSLTVPLVPLCMMVPGNTDQAGKRIGTFQVYSSPGTRVCILVYIANIFTLQTALIGLPFCLTYTALDKPSTSGLVLVLVILVVSTVVRVGAVISTVFSGKGGPLTILNRRRISVAVGSNLMLVAIAVMATEGLTDFGTLVGIAVGLLATGMGLTRISCRLNLEDLGPWTMPRLLSYVNIIGALMSIFPPIWVAAFTDLWWTIWLFPGIWIVLSSLFYMCCVTAKSQPWDERPDFRPPYVSNGAGSPRDTPAPRGHAVRMSFKSARSGLSFKSAISFQTFKTAVSRRRSRSLSTRTIDEDLSVDMRSVIDEEGADVYSVVGSSQDCKSAVSTTSFKSDGADMHSIDLNSQDVESSNQQHPEPGTSPHPDMAHGSPSDRTSEWLSHHHQVPMGNEAPLPPVPTRADMRRRNAIYDLIW
ncbi:uncharacterized protein LOC135211046 isoform X2 [Macrobrachium nipponense]